MAPVEEAFGVHPETSAGQDCSACERVATCRSAVVLPGGIGQARSFDRATTSGSPLLDSMLGGADESQRRRTATDDRAG